VEFQKRGDMDMDVKTLAWRRTVETWRHGDGDKETQRHGAWTWRHQTETEDQAMLRNMFTVCSLCKQRFVVSAFVNKQTLSVCKLTKHNKQT
jgi:hypothetical protein